MGERSIKLELTVDEVNVILLTLAERPYKEVFEIISKVRSQASPQAEVNQ